MTRFLRWSLIGRNGVASQGILRRAESGRKIDRMEWSAVRANVQGGFSHALPTMGKMRDR
jgi:hypothetical protein